jgi:hypothetical protein
MHHAMHAGCYEARSLAKLLGQGYEALSRQMIAKYVDFRDLNRKS